MDTADVLIKHCKEHDKNCRVDGKLCFYSPCAGYGAGGLCMIGKPFTWRRAYEANETLARHDEGGTCRGVPPDHGNVSTRPPATSGNRKAD